MRFFALLVVSFIQLVSKLFPGYQNQFVLGAIITGGILGGFRKKIGNVVGFNWKGIDVMRLKVTPANPQSTAQTTQRNLMAQTVYILKQILSTVVQPYWDPFAVKKSGFNAATSSLVKLLTSGTNALNANCKVAEGSLVGVDNMGFTYTTGTGVSDFTWDDNSGVGNALATDDYTMVVFNIDGTLLGVVESTVSGNTRTDGTDSMTVASGETATDVIGFLFFHRGTGASFIVSDSSAVISS